MNTTRQEVIGTEENVSEEISTLKIVIKVALVVEDFGKTMKHYMETTNNTLERLRDIVLTQEKEITDLQKRLVILENAEEKF